MVGSVKAMKRSHLKQQDTAGSHTAMLFAVMKSSTFAGRLKVSLGFRKLKVVSYNNDAGRWARTPHQRNQECQCLNCKY